MVGDAAHDGTPKSSQAHFRGTHTTSQISAHEQIRYLMHKQTVEGERNKVSLLREVACEARQKEFSASYRFSSKSASSHSFRLEDSSTVRGAPSRGSLIMHRLNFSINRNKKTKSRCCRNGFYITVSAPCRSFGWRDPFGGRIPWRNR